MIKDIDSRKEYKNIIKSNMENIRTSPIDFSNKSQAYA